MKSFIYIVVAVFFTTLSITLFLNARAKELTKMEDDIVPPVGAHQEPISDDAPMIDDAQRFVQGIVPGATITYDPSEFFIFGMAYNETNTIRLSHLYKLASAEERTYILCHEASHLLTSSDHDERFYATLERLIVKYGISWATARRIEQHYPSAWNNKP
jgi:hypothetical protein